MNRKKIRLVGSALLGALLALTLGAHAAAPETSPAVVVGTYDSRAVAVAYIRSAAAAEYLRAQQTDVERLRERARTAGDRELLEDLDALGPAMQARLHRQGFGTAPVDDILARIEDRLPAIAKEAGVDLIVSRWALTYRDPAAKLVDVTERLAAEFSPDAETWKVLRQLVATEPVAGEHVENH